MNTGGYLPSARFSAMLAALFISSGLIYLAAQSNPQFRSQTTSIYAAQNNIPDLTSTNPGWQQQFAGDTVPQQMSNIQDQANQIIQAVQTKNLTQSVGISLLVNSGALSGQNIGSDPTAQSGAINQALALARQNEATSAPAYALASVPLSTNASADLHIYGNALARAFAANPNANEAGVMLPVAQAVDANSSKPLAALTGRITAYRALARAIATIPTPPMLASPSLAVANNYARMADATANMQQLTGDPLRGLLGLQDFVSLAYQNVSLLYQISNTFKSGAIVFEKSEPGAAWAAFNQATLAAAKQQAAQPTTAQTSASQAGNASLQSIFSP